MFVAGLSGVAAQIWVQAAHRPALGYPHAGQIVMRLPSMSPPVTISFLSPLRELVPAATAVHTTPTLLHRPGPSPVCAAFRMAVDVGIGPHPRPFRASPCRARWSHRAASRAGHQLLVFLYRGFEAPVERRLVGKQRIAGDVRSARHGVLVAVDGGKRVADRVDRLADAGAVSARENASRPPIH